MVKQRYKHPKDAICRVVFQRFACGAKILRNMIFLAFPHSSKNWIGWLKFFKNLNTLENSCASHWIYWKQIKLILTRQTPCFCCLLAEFLLSFMLCFAGETRRSWSFCALRWSALRRRVPKRRNERTRNPDIPRRDTRDANMRRTVWRIASRVSEKCARCCDGSCASSKCCFDDSSNVIGRNSFSIVRSIWLVDVLVFSVALFPKIHYISGDFRCVQNIQCWLVELIVLPSFLLKNLIGS